MDTAPYKAGRQPCGDFVPEIDDYLDLLVGFRGNIHSCAGPFDADGHDPRFPGCESTVSHCDNCHWDHHEGGFETCPVIVPTEQPSRF